MPRYLTEYPEPAGIWCGPDIEADSWEEAEKKLSILVAFGMIHPETRVIGQLYAEEEWEGYYD